MLYLLFKPIDTSSIISTSQPDTDYYSAEQKIFAIQAAEGEDINKVCHTKFLSHGKKMKKVVIFFHGVTNCPQQFEQLSMELYSLGYNVYIPRLPHHGKADRLTEDLKNIKAYELSTLASQSVDIAQGLGEQVIVAGISGGGLMSAWVGQTRSDVNHSVVIAPNFSYIYPKKYAVPFTNLALTIPNHFRWWDDVAQENVVGPEYAYSRYPSRAMGEFFRLGFAIRNKAYIEIPQAEKISVVTIEGDEAVNNDITQDVVQQWKDKGHSDILTYEFPKELGLVHDIIDPNQTKQRIDIVYPKLIEVLEQ